MVLLEQWKCASSSVGTGVGDSTLGTEGKGENPQSVLINKGKILIGI